MKSNIHFWSYLVQFFLEWRMFQTKVVEKIKTHILFSVTFLRKSCRLWDNVEKYCRAGQATDDNWRVCISCWITKATHTHTLRICNILFHSPMVTRTRLNVTLHVHCPSCYSAQCSFIVDCVWNVMAHAQKPDFVLRRNGRVHLSRQGASVQSTTGTAEVCTCRARVIVFNVP